MENLQKPKIETGLKPKTAEDKDKVRKFVEKFKQDPAMAKEVLATAEVTGQNEKMAQRHADKKLAEIRQSLGANVGSKAEVGQPVPKGPGQKEAFKTEPSAEEMKQKLKEFKLSIMDKFMKLAIDAQKKVKGSMFNKVSKGLNFIGLTNGVYEDEINKAFAGFEKLYNSGNFRNLVGTQARYASLGFMSVPLEKLATEKLGKELGEAVLKGMDDEANLDRGLSNNLRQTS